MNLEKVQVKVCKAIKRLPIRLFFIALLSLVAINGLAPFHSLSHGIQFEYPSLTLFSHQGLSTDQQNFKWNPGHYFKVGRMQNYHKFIEEETPYLEVMQSEQATGFEVVIPWRFIEVSPNHYDFDYIEQSLRVADKYDKKVILRVLDRSFWNDCQGLDAPLPDHIPRTNLRRTNGCAANIWQDSVTSAYIRMMHAIADRYDNDPRLAFISTPESALSVETELSHWQQRRKLENFTNMIHEVKDAFEHTPLLVSLNWPQHYVEQIGQLIERELKYDGVGITTPDSVPARSDLRVISLMHELSGKIPIAPRVDSSAQDSESPEELYAFQRNIGANVIIWPNWRKSEGHDIVLKVLDFLDSETGALLTDCPTAILCLP